jgi:hypothetical protein
MQEIDNFNFPIVRPHYMYKQWVQVEADLRRLTYGPALQHSG